MRRDWWSQERGRVSFLRRSQDLYKYGRFGSILDTEIVVRFETSSLNPSNQNHHVRIRKYKFLSESSELFTILSVLEVPAGNLYTEQLSPNTKINLTTGIHLIRFFSALQHRFPSASSSRKSVSIVRTIPCNSYSE